MRILMRAGKSPLEQTGPSETIRRNLIANNSGNLLFAQSTFKALYVPETEIDIAGYPAAALNADEINEKYDFLVLPLANAFRKSFEGQLRTYTKVIKKLKIPVVVVGVGAQTGLDHSLLNGSAVDDTVKAFVGAVLDRSHSIGVRGDFTKRYLNKLGFDAVQTIGCPSMYLNGADLHVKKKAQGLRKKDSIAINLTPHKPQKIARLMRQTFSDHPNTYYIAQDIADARLILEGIPIESTKKPDEFPRLPDDPFLTSGRSGLFTDAHSWLSFMNKQDFAFGTRIHGNVFALLSGTPAVVVAHDSRTLELAEYYEIPHIRVDQITKQTTARSLYENADFNPMMSGHSERLRKFAAFLDQNGLPNIHSQNLSSASFDRGVAELPTDGVIWSKKITQSGNTFSLKRILRKLR